MPLLNVDDHNFDINSYSFGLRPIEVLSQQAFSLFISQDLLEIPGHAIKQHSKTLFFFKKKTTCFPLKFTLQPLTTFTSETPPASPPPSTPLQRAKWPTLSVAELSSLPPLWLSTKMRLMATSMKEKTTKKKSKMFQPGQ